MKQLAPTLLFFFICFSGFSQDNKPAWSGNLKAGLTLYSGNVNKFNMKGSGELSHFDSIFELSVFASGHYSEKDHKANKSEYTAGIKYDFHPLAIISPFALLQVYSNKQKEIRLRSSGLLGVKYGYYRTKKSNFSLSFAIQNDYDIYFSPSDESEILKPNKNIVRFSIRPKFKYKLTESIYLKHVTYYQPSILNYLDYRIYTKTVLSNQLWKSLYVEFDFIYEFDNITVYNAVEKEDYSFFVTLKYKF